jgi:uncharacterized protein YecE (DUF72 family)
LKASLSRSAQPEIRVGISGWRYAGWRGEFYPAGLPQRRELQFAAERFDSIELNGSFYSLQRPESYRAWFAEVRPEFRFAVKGSRYITHMLKLRNVRSALANFFGSGILALEEKLGPILWQLPPQLAFDGRLEEFLEQLPRDTPEAAELARHHDERLRGRSFTAPLSRAPLRYAVEVRHPSFCTPALVRLLRRHGAALVVADTAGRWPLMEDVTADFVYVRLHGDVELYKSGYGRAALKRWAERIAAWHAGGDANRARCIASPARRRRGRDVYVYFDNDAKVHAPYDAMALRRMLGLEALQTSAQA